MRSALITATFVLVSSFTLTAEAQTSQTLTVPIAASVETLFTLSCAPSAVTLAGNPGQTVVSPPIQCTVQSNWAQDTWKLTISVDRELTEVSNPSLKIPNSRFFHRSSCAQNCTPGNILASSNTAFTTTPVKYYESAASEKQNLNKPTVVSTIFELRIPPGQEAGTYMNAVIYTLTVSM